MARFQWCLDPLSHQQLKKKNAVKVGPPPRTKPRANNNSGGFDLRHHAVLETLSAADNIS